MKSLFPVVGKGFFKVSDELYYMIGIEETFMRIHTRENVNDTRSFLNDTRENRVDLIGT